MAVPCHCRCSWAINLSSVPCDCSISVSLRFRQSCLAVFSSGDDCSVASLPSSSSSSASFNRSKSSNLGISCSDADVREKDDGINVDFVSSSIWTALRENRNLSLKSLLGRRSLWRRILFASKKVRSIILLNVITIIYASNIPVLKEVEAIMDPAAFTVVRFVISAIPFIPFVAQAWDDTDTRNAGIELGFWSV